MVYCDVVESSLVGNQKHALLRELMLKDSGGQRQFVEPLHYQWLGVRNNAIEVVHVQVADADGKLLTLTFWQDHGDRDVETQRIKRRDIRVRHHIVISINHERKWFDALQTGQSGRR